MSLFGKKTSCFLGSSEDMADSGIPFNESSVPGMGMLYLSRFCMSDRNLWMRRDS